MTWEKFKSYSLRKKIDYIWDYYRWHILIAVVAVGLLSGWIYKIATHRDPLLHVQMINASMASPAGEAFEPFLKQSGYEYFEDAIAVNKNIQIRSENAAENYGAMEALFCNLAAKEGDIYFWDSPKLYPIMDDGVMADLRQVLSEELLAQYQDKLIYSENSETGEKYPCAVWLEENPWIRENQFYGNCAVGIAFGTKNQELASAFVTYLLTYEAGMQG